jgi:hypothetical protein
MRLAVEAGVSGIQQHQDDTTTKSLTRLPFRILPGVLSVEIFPTLNPQSIWR